MISQNTLLLVKNILKETPYEVGGVEAITPMHIVRAAEIRPGLGLSSFVGVAFGLQKALTAEAKDEIDRKRVEASKPFIKRGEWVPTHLRGDYTILEIQHPFTPMLTETEVSREGGPTPRTEQKFEDALTDLFSKKECSVDDILSSEGEIGIL